MIRAPPKQAAPPKDSTKKKHQRKDGTRDERAKEAHYKYRVRAVFTAVISEAFQLAQCQRATPDRDAKQTKRKAVPYDLGRAHRSPWRWVSGLAINTRVSRPLAAEFLYGRADVEQQLRRLDHGLVPRKREQERGQLWDRWAVIEEKTADNEAWDAGEWAADCPDNPLYPTAAAAARRTATLLAAQGGALLGVV